MLNITNFFNFPSKAYHLISDYAVECMDSCCPDRPLYIALQLLSKKEPAQRTWDVFPLAGKRKVYIHPWFFLGNSTMLPQLLFSKVVKAESFKENAPLPAKKESSRKEEDQNVEKSEIPDEVFSHIRPFLLKPCSVENCFDLGFMHLRGATYPELIFNFMQALHTLPEGDYQHLVAHREVYVAQFLNNLWVLAQSERFAVGIDFDLIRGEVCINLVNYIQFVYDGRFVAPKSKENQKAFKLTLHTPQEEISRSLSWYYQLKFFIEVFNTHTRLARSIFSEQAKLNVALFTREDHSIEVRAFFNKWYRIVDTTLTTTLDRKQIKEFKDKYLNHASETIRELARACLQLHAIQETHKKYRHASKQLLEAQENLTRKECHVIVRGYAPLFGALYGFPIPKGLSLAHTAVSLKEREKVLEASFPSLRSLEFLYRLLHTVLTFIQGSLDQMLLTQRRKLKTFAVQKEDIINSRVKSSVKLLVLEAQVQGVSTQKRAVKQVFMHRFMPEIEMPSPAQFARSLLLNPQHGFLTEEVEEDAFPAEAISAKRSRVASTATAAAPAAIESEEDEEEVAPKVASSGGQPAVAATTPFTYTTLKSILRVKDSDPYLRGDFLYHQRVCAWFDELDKTGKRWDEIEDVGLRVHTFPLALDKYVGSLFSERGEWTNPATGEKQTQYKLPIEITQGGKTTRYVVRYTRTNKGVWYHRDMTLQERHLWSSVDFPPSSRETLAVQGNPKNLQLKTKAKTETFDPETETVTIDFTTVQITLFRVR